MAILTLAGASTVAVAAATGALNGRHSSQSADCAAPTRPDNQVDVTLSDMSSMMRGGQLGWRTWQSGLMRINAVNRAAARGTVLLRVRNAGGITHELLVLPLSVGQPTGARVVHDDGKVDETGVLGEASRSCAGGAGNGITPGTTGWTTLVLPAGRYELICNLPGHYAAGMYTELLVT